MFRLGFGRPTAPPAAWLQISSTHTAARSQPKRCGDRQPATQVLAAFHALPNKKITHLRIQLPELAVPPQHKEGRLGQRHILPWARRLQQHVNAIQLRGGVSTG